MSSESVENILYYKDCNHKKPTIRPLRQQVQRPQQQQCKMFCTMCCGDQCVNTPQMGAGEQTQVVESRILPISPNMQKQIRKIRPKLQPPIPERRGMSFTRDNIKSLIAKDEDIRKILKDLVRVTMQKVDLMELMKNRNAEKMNSDASNESESDNVL